MTKLKYVLILSVFFLALAFGCIGGGESEFNETKLEVEEGVGIVDTLKIEELNPGLDGYVSLTIRSNLGGEGASNVIIGIDNVKPFKIVECGADRDPEEIRGENCAGQLDKDRNLPFRMRGTAKLFPGEELDVFWRLKAPSKDEISDIALKHPLYYDVEYDYRVNFHQSIIFMSQNEMLRRRQAGEDYIIEGESGGGAGELRFTGTTQQPVIYFFDYEPGSEQESDFNFALQYFVENKGKGFPLSDVVLLLEYPANNKIEPDSNIPEGSDKTNYEIYGWHKWNEWDGKIILADGTTSDCRTGDIRQPLINCKGWVEQTFGEDFKKVETDKVLVKVVKREDFVDSFSVYAPMVMTGQERTFLRNSNIPLKIYSFNVYAMYRYFIEGKEYITVFPVRGI